MRARSWIAAFALLSLPTSAIAADAGAPKASEAGAAKASDGGTARPLNGNEPVPPGHPSMGNVEVVDGEEGEQAEPANPHQHGGANGMFQAPADTSQEDPSLPAGSISIDLRDAENKPLPNVEITLGILQQSVAKGESRKHVAKRSDEAGVARFDGLETGSGIAYRVSVPKDGATFAAMPFQLAQNKGTHVVLHVYPVTSDVEQAMIVMQTAIYAELRDDRIQFEQAVNIFNFGKSAWVPKDLVLTLPPDFTALTAQESMSGQGVDPVEKRGGRLHGTFGPGEHSVVFRWQLPYGGESQVQLRVGMPPHVAAARVLSAAAQSMQLVVEGFPQAMPNVEPQGGRILETQKEMRRGDPPLKEITISLKDIPTKGPAAPIATALAALGVLFGIGYAYNGRGRRIVVPRDDIKRARQRLLYELEELERAHKAGDVGPKTYEASRRKLIDALARTLG
jgi:hypothetical protein